MTFDRRFATTDRSTFRADTAFWMHRWRIAITVAIATTVSTMVVEQAAGVEATSSRVARDEAIHAIPWRQLTPVDRKDAEFVVKNASIYRRLPTRVIDCDPEMFTFLVQHPEVIVDVWRVMGVSRVKLDKQPDGVFRGSDGAGTTGTVRYMYVNWADKGENRAVVFADGAYDGQPLLRPIRAKTLMLMHWSSVQETNGRHYITVNVDAFVHIEQFGIELVAKTVQPWITRMADQNFIETLTFVSNFSRTAEQNPHGMQRLADRLATIDEPTRRALVQLCFRTAERYAQRSAPAPSQATRLLARGDETAPAEVHRAFDARR